MEISSKEELGTLPDNLLEREKELAISMISRLKKYVEDCDEEIQFRGL